MRKILYFFTAVLITVIMFYFTIINGYIFKFCENKVYEIKNQKISEINSLNNLMFFNKYIFTYNNNKIIFLDLNNNIVYESNKESFSEKLFTTYDYIFRCLNNSIEMVDKNNTSFLIPEINGEILNVSRENGKTCIITKHNNGQNSLYILNENNEIVVNNKLSDNKIISVSMSDKSEGYSLTTLNIGDEKINSTLYFNLLDDIELWNVVIDNEIIIGTKIINNNILAIGTENIYYYNLNGKLMWKIGNYNKVTQYEISKVNGKIYILQNEGTEFIAYDFEGKVKEIYKTNVNAAGFKVFDNRIFLYDDNNICLLHDNKFDELFKDNKSKIVDLNVEKNNIYILFKNKLVKGQIN